MTLKKMSLRTRAILLVSFFMITSNLLLGSVLVRQTRNATKTQINDRMLDIVNTAAASLNGDVLKRLRAEDKGTPEYQEVLNTLVRFRDNINLDYIYYVRDMGDGTFTFGIDTDPVAPGEFGSPVVYTDALFKASQGTPSVDEEPYEDSWGRFYSAFSPVFDSDGKVAGVVTADFSASWYEEQIDRSQRTILIACALFLAVGISLSIFFTGQYTRQLELIRRNVSDLAVNLESLTNELSDQSGKQDSSVEKSTPGAEGALSGDTYDSADIQSLGIRISSLKDELRNYITNANTQANSMITAMSTDYRCVYFINLDEDDGVCYRNDPSDDDQTPPGMHFSFHERFSQYANSYVTEKYREGFLECIDPDRIREKLAVHPLIVFRYLAERGGRQYYEMLRMAGVRRAEDRDDHIVHAVGLGLTEIDEEVRRSMAKNEALADALSQAEEANRAKTAFLSSMSHEIRTPMNAIIGLDTLALRDDTLSEQTRDYLEKIGGSAHHLLGLINNILDMSRIESGKMVLRQEEFSFDSFIEQINNMVMPQCADKGLTYECRILSGLDSFYIGDDMKLREVLINILSNAIKFTEAPGSVTLFIERTAVFGDQSTLKFRVKDTGIGIEEDYLPKIFDAFTQEDSSTKNRFGSTGLGMAITRNIVEMMNGKITVESEKGVGTEVTVVITLRQSHRREENAESGFDAGKLRVLIADDDADSAESTRAALDDAGIWAQTCTGADEALRLTEVQSLKQEPFHLLLVDWKKQNRDFLESIKEIRKNSKTEPMVILLMSAHPEEIADQGREAGADGLLRKPVSPTELVDVFQRITLRSGLDLFVEKEQASLEGRRILLAEDIEINAEIMMDILSMKDMEIDHAQNGQIALDLFSKSSPGTYSAILMDIRMPVMDGMEAASAIRALDRPDAKTIPIIALTANAFDEDVQRSLQHGMNAHLSKPVESELLYQTLGELIFEAEA